MDQTTKFQKVMDILKEKGMTDDQIAEFATDLTKTNFTRVYSEAIDVFTEDDLKAIDETKDQDEANTLIAQKYKERTGKEISGEMQKFLDVFSDGFLAEYEKDKAGSQVTTEPPSQAGIPEEKPA